MLKEKKFGLPDSCILKGHDSFKRVIGDSRVFTGTYLKAYVRILSSEYKRSSPLFTDNVKVGFLIAKKRIRNAVLRNRIRRLMREDYRMHRKILTSTGIDAELVLTLTNSGYDHFTASPGTKAGIFVPDLTKLSEYLLKSSKKA